MRVLGGDREGTSVPRPSFLDRLLDEDPDRSSDPPKSPREQHEEFREAIRRDLQDLLNTRQNIFSVPADLELARDSVAEFGIPDLTGVNLTSKRSRTEFLATLAPLIRRSDPRFRHVQVLPLDGDEPTDRNLRFRIVATVMAEAGGEEAQFDFELEPVSKRFR